MVCFMVCFLSFGQTQEIMNNMEIMNNEHWWSLFCLLMWKNSVVTIHPRNLKKKSWKLDWVELFIHGLFFVIWGLQKTNLKMWPECTHFSSYLCHFFTFFFQILTSYYALCNSHEYYVAHYCSLLFVVVHYCSLLFVVHFSNKFAQVMHVTSIVAKRALLVQWMITHLIFSMKMCSIAIVQTTIIPIPSLKTQILPLLLPHLLST